MKLKITINLQFDPAVVDALTAIAQGLARPATSCTTVIPASPPRSAGRPPKRPAYIEPTAPNGLEAHRTPVLAPDTPAMPVTPEIAAIPPATNETEAKPKRNTQPRPQLPFAEFDTLVGKELKRLSVDGRIPSASLWDEHRDPRLPTYGAVMQRYGCTNLATFAEKMGMQPPLTRAMTINQNGANAIHSK